MLAGRICPKSYGTAERKTGAQGKSMGFKTAGDRDSMPIEGRGANVWRDMRT